MTEHQWNIQAKGILLDIEGTTSSIRFVYDVMFPYVRENLVNYLNQHWGSDAVQKSVDLLALDAGYRNTAEWLQGWNESQQIKRVEAAVIQLMDNDVKATGLKQLQGQIWESGFRNGKLVAHLYADVAPAIRHWKSQGLEIRIYSSGSIAAQKLFFGHTVEGDLLKCFTGHYDTTTGTKQDVASYRKIADDFGYSAHQILFISDVPGELQAADQSGMQVLLSLRPGNATIDQPHSFTAITSFAEIQITPN